MKQSAFSFYIFVLVLFLMTKNVFANNSCHSLFLTHLNSQSETRQIFQDRNADTLVTLEKRSEKVWVQQEQYKNKVSQFVFSFFPEKMNLSVYSSDEKKDQKKDLVLETIVQTENGDRLRQDQIPLDQSLMLTNEVPTRQVIDATIESGRRFFLSLLQQEKAKPEQVQGTFIFIDVNNLGYINKNFFNKSKSGDQIIQKIAEMLTEVIRTDLDSQGLVFRLGGDEFGLVLPSMSSEVLSSLQSRILTQLRQQVHSYFSYETKVRVENLRVMKKAVNMGLSDEAAYHSELELFKKYAAYSQEGLSIGAAFVDGRSSDEIQMSAENLAAQMKLVVKTQNRQDISKYTEEKVILSGAPRLAFRYQFPLLHQEKQLIENEKQLGVKAEKSIIPPAIQKTRVNVVYRFGQVNIVRYKAEDHLSEMRVEYFSKEQGENLDKKQDSSPDRLAESEVIDLHSHSGFIDAKSIAAKKLINYYLNSYLVDRGVIWINLLNLGKLNYFKDKTLTGDRMIKRLSEVIATQLRQSDLPFKLAGSEFIIFFDQVGPVKLKKIQERIQLAINSDPQILQIFAEQIQFLEIKKNNEPDKNKRDEIQKKIDETSTLLSGSKVEVKSGLITSGQQETDLAALVNKLL